MNSHEELEQLKTRVTTLEIKFDATVTELNKIDTKLDMIHTQVTKFKGATEARSAFTQTTLNIISTLATVGAGGYIFKLLGW